MVLGNSKKLLEDVEKNLGNGGHQDNVKGQWWHWQTLRDNKSIGKTLGSNQNTLNNIKKALNNIGKTSKHNKK